MLKYAKVLRNDGDIATVEAYSTTACESCHNKNCALSCLMSEKKDDRKKIVSKAYNFIGARSGDIVCIEMKDQKVLFYSFLVFVFPLIIAFGTFIAADSFVKEEYISLIISFLSFAFSFLLIYIFERKIVRNQINITITKVLNESELNEYHYADQ